MYGNDKTLSVPAVAKEDIIQKLDTWKWARLYNLYPEECSWRWLAVRRCRGEEISYSYTGLLKTKEVIQIFIALSPYHWSDIAAWSVIWLIKYKGKVKVISFNQCGFMVNIFCQNSFVPFLRLLLI